MKEYIGETMQGLAIPVMLATPIVAAILGAALGPNVVWQAVKAILGGVIAAFVLSFVGALLRGSR